MIKKISKKRHDSQNGEIKIGISNIIFNRNNAKNALKVIIIIVYYILVINVKR